MEISISPAAFAVRISADSPSRRVARALDIEGLRVEREIRAIRAPPDGRPVPHPGSTAITSDATSAKAAALAASAGSTSKDSITPRRAGSGDQRQDNPGKAGAFAGRSGLHGDAAGLQLVRGVAGAAAGEHGVDGLRRRGVAGDADIVPGGADSRDRQDCRRAA